MSVVVDVTCPWCGATSVVDPARRRADDFCPGREAPCDYPLFWAVDRWPSAVAEIEPDEAADDASLRRRPGTAGRAWVAGLPCPECREPNDPDDDRCARCGAALRPVAAEEPAPSPPAPRVVPVAVAVAPAAPWWRPWPAAIAVVLALVLLADVAVVLGRR